MIYSYLKREFSTFLGKPQLFIRYNISLATNNGKFSKGSIIINVDLNLYLVVTVQWSALIIQGLIFSNNYCQKYKVIYLTIKSCL